MPKRTVRPTPERERGIPPTGDGGPVHAELLCHLRDIESDVRALHCLIAADRPYTEALAQVAVLVHAMRAVAHGIVEPHLRTCMEHAIHGSVHQREDMLTEIELVCDRALRT